ncbi:leucine-rich repeat-containing protein 15-like [Chironomus tepperi]|uniref:leucine-rich repeat-containing protein 15-like n=1 Tax=Chironomus tepperi TaxID=113505 RepID=UPI00391F1E37
MIWKAIVVLFCVTFVPSHANIFCDYQYNENNNLYTCNMLIYNPTGGPINSIFGNHLPGLSVTALTNSPFQRCSNLDMLSLRDNKITSLQSALFQNTILEELYLDNNVFDQIDSSLLDGLNNLKTLSFKGNVDISFNGPAFEHLQNLKYLDLSKCNFTGLVVEWFENGLSQLEVLNLAENALTEIPANAFKELTGLEVLALDFNKISTLHEDSFELPSLISLFLDSNHLADLQDNVFSKLASLKILYLSENDCSNFAPNIFKPLTSLTTLAMHSCSIVNIKPEWFQSLGNLSILLLEENEFAEFPEKMFLSSDNLKLLSVYGNKLTELNSRSFGSVEALSHLDVRKNNISGIDHHFMNQSEVMKIAMFSDNRCATFDTVDYGSQSEQYMQQLNNCFDNFDNTPIVLVTNNSPTYEWYNIRTNEGWRDIQIQVTASQSAHVALSEFLGSDTLLEILFGEKNNTVLQLKDRGIIVDTYEIPDILSHSIRINLGFGFITLFKDDEQFPFHGFFIRQSFPINFFGLRTQIPPTTTSINSTWNVLRLKR